jgi:hypothetical protein
VPAHVGFADAVMETLEIITGLTVMVTGFDVAGFPVAHNKSEVR